MAELLKGAPVAAAMSEALKEDCARLRERGVTPTLAILRVGARGDDLAYERAALKRCAAVGVEARCEPLADDVTQGELLEMIRRLNEDPGVHGILLFRPLPEHLDERAACAALLPEKDVDGVTAGSLSGVFTGTGAGFPPCTASACMALLRHYGVETEGRRAVVLGRSLVVGRPVAMLLQQANATVTMCHSRTKDLPAECRRAEILIAAAGQAGMVGADCLSPEQTVLDVGIHALPDGSLCGDVAFAAAQQIVRAITPVPGGVGAVTACVLAAHVVEAAKRAVSKEGRSSL